MIVNNINGKGLEDISDKFVELLTGKEDQPFVIVYHKQHTHKSTLDFYFAYLGNEININNPEDEGDIDIRLKVEHDEYQFKANNKDWEKVNGNLRIPINSNFIDIERVHKMYESLADKSVTSLDKEGFYLSPFSVLKKNTFNFYFGEKALELMDELAHYKEK